MFLLQQLTLSSPLIHGPPHMVSGLNGLICLSELVVKKEAWSKEGPNSIIAIVINNILFALILVSLSLSLCRGLAFRLYIHGEQDPYFIHSCIFKNYLELERHTVDIYEMNKLPFIGGCSMLSICHATSDPYSKCVKEGLVFSLSN